MNSNLSKRNLIPRYNFWLETKSLKKTLHNKGRPDCLSVTLCLRVTYMYLCHFKYKQVYAHTRFEIGHWKKTTLLPRSQDNPYTEMNNKIPRLRTKES